MEKELPPPESMTSVQIKQDYAPSEVYSSEPPPAYRRPKSVSVQVAKIIAVTIVLVSVVLGGCILASAYITANASCRHLEQELQLLSETMDRYPPLQPEALVQEEPQQKENLEPLETQETKAAKEVRDNALPTETSDSQDSSSEESSESNTSEDSDEEERMGVQIKLPIQIDFDDIAGAMMEKNQKSKMNCIVEKKRAEEVIDHKAKTVNLPFGLNLTTDPRYERVTGERIAIFCESGNVQRQPEPQDQEETIMIQPIMIPLPSPQFHTHMPMQAAPQMQQQYHHPMEQMRPPMQNPIIQMQQASQNQLPPSGILHQIAQQIIAQKLQQEAERSQEEVQGNELRQDSEERTPPNRIEIQQTLSRIPIPEEVLTQINRLPNRDVIVAVSQQAPEEAPQMRVIQHQRQTAQEINGRQSYARGMPIPIVMQQEQEEDTSATEGERMHKQMRPPMPNPIMQMLQARQNQFPPIGMLHQIAQQIIADNFQQEAERSQEEVQENELRQDSEERTPLNRIEIQQTLSRIPFPEEVLSQINRLPNRDDIVAVSQQASEEAPQMRVIQHQRQTAQEVNGRQSDARGMPIPIVVQQEQEDDTSATEGERMHKKMRPLMPNPIMQMLQASQNEFPPVGMLDQIAQQIIADNFQQEVERSQEEVQENELRQDSEERTPLNRIEIQPTLSRIPIPEEVLTQINKLTNRNDIVAVSQQASEKAGRQSDARGMTIPIVMQQEQEKDTSATEGERMHKQIGSPMPNPIMQMLQASQNQFPPIGMLDQIAQQIIADNFQQEAERLQEEPPNRIEIQQTLSRIPFPEEVLSQINRLPNRDDNVVVSQQASEEAPQMRVIQDQRQTAQEINGRQSGARGTPIPIVMQQEQEEDTSATEGERMHKQIGSPMPNPIMQMLQASQNQFPPIGMLHQIAQQIIADNFQQEAKKSQEEVQGKELRQDSEERSPPNRIEIQQTLSRIPIPEEVSTQINRLPNRDDIVAVSQQASEEAPQMRVIQHQRQTAQEMNDRQSDARGTAIPIVMQQEQEENTSTTEGEGMHSKS